MTSPSDMDVVAMYDYYYFDAPHRKIDDRCEYGMCENNIVYRRLSSVVEKCKRTGERLSDVLEYMLYNVAGDTGLPAHYSCCIYVYKTNEPAGDGGETECGHACNAIPIMIGSRLELKIITRLSEMLGVSVCDVYDTEYLHKVYSGTFLVNGTFYYSVFRESNNNKICHNSKSKYRGDETVAYFYDNTCNRGVKLFTDRSERLRVNDRDGNEVTDVTSAVMLQLYKECTQNWCHYTTDMRLVAGFFAAVKSQGVSGIDDFKNKIYTNYSIGLNTFLDKLPSSAMCNPMWNASLMVGKINLGISQRLNYPKSKSETKKQNEQKLKMCTGGMSTGYLVETQRRRNVRKATTHCHHQQAADHETTESKRRKHEGDELNDERPVVKKCKKNGGEIAAATTNTSGGHTILGSKDVKTVGLMEKLEQGERNGPSTFNQVSVSYLPLIRVLSNTVQKLQVEHVHAESSKTVPRDAYGFICMKYMGNISTAGKNMLFTDRVQVSYGHVQRIVEKIERGIESLETKNYGLIVSADRESGDGTKNGLYVVINNAVTTWRVARDRMWEFVVFVKTRCHRYAWTKLVGDYLCVFYYEGVPLLRYDRGESMFDTLRCRAGLEVPDVECLYFSRHELETLARETEPLDSLVGKKDLINTTNTLIDKWFTRPFYHDEVGGNSGAGRSSLLAKHMDQYTDYTAPAKRSVSVNARKSACINVYYQRAADLIRGFNIFTDPDGYERTTAERTAENGGPPTWVTLRDFTRARAERENCPQPQDGTDRSLANFYMLRTIFADVEGYNVEDANVLDESVDLSLSYSYSFSLTFVDRSKLGLDIIVPPPREAVSICCWDAKGEPTTVVFVVCTIRKRDGEECSASDVEEMLRLSSDTRMVNNANNSKATTGTGTSSRQSSYGDTIGFPPFRKLSVIQSADGNYHVYFMRNDAVLLRSVHKLREKWTRRHSVPNMSNARRLSDDSYAFVCVPEVKPYDALTSLQTKITTFEANAEERIVTLDVRVHGRTDKYDGVKIVNSFGQKGLALIKDLRPYFSPSPPGVPVQLVMNNCSFVSRQPIGQYMQMKKNMFAVTTSAADEPTSVGYTAVFFTETEPVTKSCLVRFDEMMRSVIITLGLTVFQNVKNSLDNVYNPFGVLYPPQTRQILSLYKCMGVAYGFAGDRSAPFASKDDVDLLIKIYDVYSKTPKPVRVAGCRALLDVLDVVTDEDRFNRLSEIGILTEKKRDRGRGRGGGPSRRRRTYLLNLQGRRFHHTNNNSATSPSRRPERPDYVVKTYSSQDDTYKTLYIIGDPGFIADVLDNRYSTIDSLIDSVTMAATTDRR